MKLEVYGEQKDVVRLKPIQDGGTLWLVAVDSNSNVIAGGYLLHVSVHGIQLPRGINSELGFDLDSEGRLKVT